MDYIFGAVLVLSIACITMTASAIRSAGEAKRQAASAHRLTIALQSRDSVQVMEDGTVEVFAVRGDHVQKVYIGAPKVTPGNLVIKGGSITIDSPATKSDINDIRKRIQALQDKTPPRGD